MEQLLIYASLRVTFLLLVDERNEQIYWTAPLKEIENKDLSAQDIYTFHVPKINCLDKNSIPLHCALKLYSLGVPSFITVPIKSIPKS